MTFRATATTTVGGVYCTPQMGVLIPFTRDTISENFTLVMIGKQDARVS